MKKKKLKKELRECREYLKESEKREDETFIEKDHLFRACRRRNGIIRHLAETIDALTDGIPGTKPMEKHGEQKEAH